VAADIPWIVITTLAARFYLHETVSGARWAGVVLIVMGAGLVSWSQQAAENKGEPITPAASGISKAAEG
jgi:drug/metabolite transporter (DMT)-like permease